MSVVPVAYAAPHGALVRGGRFPPLAGSVSLAGQLDAVSGSLAAAGTFASAVQLAGALDAVTAAIGTYSVPHAAMAAQLDGVAAAMAAGPLSFVPPVGYRSNINANSASDVDYDLTSGVPLAQRWWNGYGLGNSFASMVTSYCGTVWAPEYSTHGAFVINGGGHGGQIGQFSYVFDFAARQWRCVGAPGNVPTTSEWCGYADARTGVYSAALDQRSTTWLDYNYGGSYITIADHTYMQGEYIPQADGGGTLGSLWLPESHYTQTNGQTDTRPGGSGFAALWAPHLQNMSTGVQSRAVAAPHGEWPGYALMASVRDTTRRRLWAMLNGTPFIYYYDLSAGPPYTRVAHTMQRAAGGNATWCLVKNSTLVYVPEADAIVSFFPDNSNSIPPDPPANGYLNIEVYSMDTGVPIDQEVRDRPSPPRISMPRGGVFVGACWVPASVVGGVGKFYLYEGYGSTQVFTMTPSSLNFKTCTWTPGQESFSNAHSGADPVAKSGFVGGFAQANAVQGKWQFVPALGCIAWHDGPTTSAPCFDGITRTGIVQLWRPPGTPV